MFNPALHQPNNVFFDVKIGGLERIYHYPNIPVEMVVNLSNQELSTLQLTLFDEAGAEVEPYIWQSRDPDTGECGGTIKWGYTQPEGIESDERKFVIQNYRPRFVDGAFSLSIFAILDDFSIVNSSNQYSGTLEEILNKVADDMKLSLKIDPPFGKQYMQDCGAVDRNSTKKVERKFNKFGWESNWRYVNRLLYYAVDQEGKVGYKAIVTSQSGQPTLLVGRGKNGSADYEYTVFDKDSVVIDWAPDVGFTALFDSNDVHFNGHETATGDPAKTALHQENTKDKLEDFGQDHPQNIRSRPPKKPPDKNYYTCPETMPENVAGKGCGRQRPAPSRTCWGGNMAAFYSHVEAWMEENTASLVVCGDPRSKEWSDTNVIPTVDVTFNRPLGYFNRNNTEKHYTSGIWQVTDVIHRVSLGRYETEYKMWRPGHEEAPKAGESGGGAQ